MKKILKLLVLALISAALMTTSACAADGSVDDEGSATLDSGIVMGTIELRVTDPPPADVATAIVSINNVEVHIASDSSDSTANTSGDNSTGEWITILDTPTSFDLMEVLGVEQILGSTNVSTGKYTQIRLDVNEVTGTLTDGTPYTADVPGDKLKIVRPFEIEEGVTTVLTLDFDGEKSLISKGNGEYSFKPVVKLLVGGLQEQEQEQETEMEQEQGEDAGDEPEEEKEQEQGSSEEKLEATIDSINGTSWSVTVDGEPVTVDVSEAEIKGNPGEGDAVTIEGLFSEDIFIADEVSRNGNQ